MCSFGRPFLLLLPLLTLLNVRAADTDTRGTPADPAAEMEQKPKPLTAVEEKTCRDLFKQLASDDFDARDQALNGLVAHGPAVLTLAAEFEKDADAEIAAQAKSLYAKILCSYDGYLPTNAALRKALAKRVSVDKPFTLKALEELAKENGVTVVRDPLLKPSSLDTGIMPQTHSVTTLGDWFGRCAALSEAAGIPRGDVYLLASPETSERLARKRRTYDWRALQLDRDAATDLVTALQPLFPQQSTEMHAGGEMLVLQGVDAALPRMARVVALLTPGAPDAAWPASQNAPGAARDLEQDLCAPVSITIASDQPIVALEQLTAHLHPVVLVGSADPDGEPVDLKLLKKYSVESREDLTLAQFQDLSDIRLKLRDMPLGLALRWIERRSKFLNDNQFPRLFAYETGPAGRLQFRVQPKPRPELENAVGGADVAFLYEANTKLSWANDKAMVEKIWKVLEPHLELFPSFVPTRGLAVIHGRMLISAPWATAQRAVELIKEWRETGKPPAAPEWYEQAEQRLNGAVDWDGIGMSGGEVLKKLTELSGMNILMEESADGHAPDFQISHRDAALLPPGQHTVRELLDDLAGKVHADWSVQLGAIVLTPKSEPAKEKEPATVEKGGGF